MLGPLLPVDRFTSSDRRIVAVIWTAGLVQGFAQSQVSATLPFTRAGLGLTEGELSLLLGIARLAAFAALPLGWLGDHRGRRTPLLWSITLVVVGGVLAGLAMAQIIKPGAARVKRCYRARLSSKCPTA